MDDAQPTGSEPVSSGFSETAPRPASADLKPVVALAALALLARAAAALQTRVIAPDGVSYVALAKRFHDGDFSSAIAHPHHPLYPLLVAIFRFIVPDWTAAASTVSVLFGALTLVPLFILVRSLAGRNAALFAAFLYTFLPPFVRFGADAISEATFLFFLASALALGYRAASRDGRFCLAAPGAACAVLAYLTRPEGLGIPLVLVAWALLRVLLRRAAAIRGLAAAALFAAIFGLLALPYFIHIRVETGRWAPTKKKPIENLLHTYEGEHTGGKDAPEATDLPATATWPGALLKTLGALARALFFHPILLIALGLYARRRNPEIGNGLSGIENGSSRQGGRRDWADDAFLIIPFLLWIAVGTFLARSHGYVSHRHTSPAALLLLVYAGAGGEFLASLAARAIARFSEGHETARIRVISLASLAVVLALCGSTTAFRAYRSGKTYVKSIGRDIRKARGEGAVVVGNRIRISYYAGGAHHDIPPFEDWNGVRKHLLEVEADLFVVDLGDPHFAIRHAALVPLLEEGREPEGLRFLRNWEYGEETGRQRDIRAYSVDREALLRAGAP